MMSVLESSTFPNKCELTSFENIISVSMWNAPHVSVMLPWSWECGPDLRDGKPSPWVRSVPFRPYCSWGMQTDRPGVVSSPLEVARLRPRLDLRLPPSLLGPLAAAVHSGGRDMALLPHLLLELFGMEGRITWMLFASCVFTVFLVILSERHTKSVVAICSSSIHWASVGPVGEEENKSRAPLPCRAFWEKFKLFILGNFFFWNLKQDGSTTLYMDQFSLGDVTFLF